MGGERQDASNPPKVLSPETVGAALGSRMLSLLFVNFASVDSAVRSIDFYS